MFLLLGETTVLSVKVWMNHAADGGILRWTVNGSKYRFSFYLIKCDGVWKVSAGTGWLCDGLLLRPHVDVYPKRDPLRFSWICLAFTMACICQGTERDSPVPYVEREDFTWALFVLSHQTLFAPRLSTGTTKPTLLIFSVGGNGTGALRQFSAVVHSLHLVLVISQLHWGSWCLMFFNWADLMLCDLTVLLAISGPP